MRVTALALLLALLFPTAAASFASRTESSCCCTRKGAKSCPMKRKAETCNLSREASCGIRQSDPGAAVVPMPGDRQPAILLEASTSEFRATPRSLFVRDVLILTRFLKPPEPPPPKRA